MLNHPTIDKLHELRLLGMAKALKEQNQALNAYEQLTFEDRLTLLVDREATERDNNRLRLRLKQAKLRLTATVEDLDFHHPRGLDKSLVLTLAGCRWIYEHHNVIVTGPTGVGKSYLACALAHKACREGFRTLYLRALVCLTTSCWQRPTDGTVRYSRPMPDLTCVSLMIGGWAPYRRAKPRHLGSAGRTQ